MKRLYKPTQMNFPLLFAGTIALIGLLGAYEATVGGTQGVKKAEVPFYQAQTVQLNDDDHRI